MKVKWICTQCGWGGKYTDAAPVMYHGVDWQNCPSCGAVAIPITEKFPFEDKYNPLEALPYMKAVKSLHNGYNPKYREATGDKEPKNPRAAIKQLIGEAEALALAECKQEGADLAELRDAVREWKEAKDLSEYDDI